MNLFMTVFFNSVKNDCKISIIHAIQPVKSLPYFLHSPYSPSILYILNSFYILYILHILYILYIPHILYSCTYTRLTLGEIPVKIS